MEEKKTVINVSVFLIGAIAILILFNQVYIYKIYKAIGNNEITGELVKSADAVNLDLYVMSQCPYGVQVENAVKPVMDSLKGKINLDINFIGSAANGKFNSMHGQNEVDGDIIHLCAKKYYPNSYLDFIVCQNSNPRDFKGTLQNCATQNKMDSNKITSCMEGEEGTQLLSASFQKSDSVGARGSPTIFINNQPYNSNRDTQSFLNAVCSYFSIKPSACANSNIQQNPAPVAVEGGCN